MNIKNKYNVILLIEKNISAEIWNPEIEAFKNKLQENAQLNDINTYTFGQNEKLSIVDENNNKFNLLDNKSDENNLVFIISDSSSILWRNSEVYNLLEELKNISLVSLVNLLPKDMYIVQATEVNCDIQSNIVAGAKNNNEIILEDNPYSDFGSAGLILPMENMNKVDNLLNTLLNGGTLQNTKVFVNNEFTQNNKRIALTEDEKKAEAEKKVQNYRQVSHIAFSSTEPFQLATFFCERESFTLSDVDFVRQHMLPGSNKKIMNLFMISNLVEKINEENEETLYKLNESVDYILRRSLRGKDYDAVELLLKEKKSQESEKLELLRPKI